GPLPGHRVPRWRAASWNDMFPNSISVGARMPVRVLALVLLSLPVALPAQRTQKPPLHGRHWVAITGKPLAATAGAMMFQKGGNPVDAVAALLEHHGARGGGERLAGDRDPVAPVQWGLLRALSRERDRQRKENEREDADRHTCSDGDRIREHIVP